jgi:hypothetical protein
LKAPHRQTKHLKSTTAQSNGSLNSLSLADIAIEPLLKESFTAQISFQSMHDFA